MTTSSTRTRTHTCAHTIQIKSATVSPPVRRTPRPPHARRPSRRLSRPVATRYHKSGSHDADGHCNTCPKHEQQCGWEGQEGQKGTCIGATNRAFASVQAAGCGPGAHWHACVCAAVQPARVSPAPYSPLPTADAPPLCRRSSVRRVIDALGAAACDGQRPHGQAGAAVVAGSGPPF